MASNFFPIEPLRKVQNLKISAMPSASKGFPISPSMIGLTSASNETWMKVKITVPLREKILVLSPCHPQSFQHVPVRRVKGHVINHTQKSLFIQSHNIQRYKVNHIRTLTKFCHRRGQVHYPPRLTK